MFTSDEKPAIGRQINRFLLWLDRIPLWWTGILIVVVFFSPYFILGDGCIFEINDQLDESIMNYMLPARHLWDGSTVYPEMLGESMPAVCSHRPFYSCRCIVCFLPGWRFLHNT